MILSVKPTARLKGQIYLPASKSYSIRAFIVAACAGHSQIVRPSDCDDALVAMRVARQLGARIKQSSAATWQVTARPGEYTVGRINVGESGTVLRFVLPLLSLQDQRVVVAGEGTLRGRPNRHLVEALRAQGVRVRGTGPGHSIPINILGGSLRGGVVHIEGSVSSQFVSALLIACPQLPVDTTVVIKGRDVVSLDYITMTRQILRAAGVNIQRVNDRRYKISGGQTFQGLKNFIVPSDYGLAAFLLAAGVIVPSAITLKGHLRDKFVQADGRILSFLRTMGVKYSKTDSAVSLAGPFQLKGGDFSLKDCPDLVPIMAVLSLFARGRVRLRHIGHARVKESDRIGDLSKELLKVGARIIQKKDELMIEPRPGGAYRSGVVLDPHHDHRLAMAFAVLGLKLGVRVKDVECVSKSYPGFVRDMRCLGARFSVAR